VLYVIVEDNLPLSSPVKLEGLLSSSMLDLVGPSTVLNEACVGELALRTSPPSSKTDSLSPDGLDGVPQAASLDRGHPPDMLYELLRLFLCEPTHKEGKVKETKVNGTDD
jgi:hypothetical protein